MTSTQNCRHCTTKVLLCRCARDAAADPAIAEAILTGLDDLDIDLTVVDDFCAIAAKGDGHCQGLFTDPDLTVVACEPRAVRWLLHFAGAEEAAASISVLNARTATAQEILHTISSSSCCRESAEPVEIEQTGEWLPWFPVIDLDRCTHCQQCASFCLFDVYSVSSAGKVEVTQPANCKPHCPACARVCPEGAIMFPKSRELQINGGQPLNGDMSAVACADLQTIFGGDPLAALAARGHQARSRQLLNAQAMARAEAERARCACSCSCEPATEPRVVFPMMKPKTPCCPAQSATRSEPT